MKAKEHSKLPSGDGYKNISKSLNIPQSSVRSINKKRKEYGTCVNLPEAGCPPKLSYCARRRQVRDVTKTPRTTLQSAAQDEFGAVVSILFVPKEIGATRVGKPLLIYNLFCYDVKMSCDCTVRHHFTSSEHDQLR